VKAVLERLTWFRQAAIRYAGEGLTLYIDPWGTSAEDPKADLILITHAHFDHLQPREIERLCSPGTKLVAPHDVAKELSGDVTAVAPGESHEVAGVRFETVPAYNVAEERLDMHPKANGWSGTCSSRGARHLPRRRH
jgi:L-ascorbate metabolism protein UlaG (beta-lactamase superfamily)